MIPQETSRLPIGIVIILVLSRHDEVLCPSVKRSTRRRPMQMNGTLSIAMIDEPYNRLGTARYDDRWSGRGAIVPDKTSSLFARIYLVSEGLDVQLIIPDLLVSHRIDYLSSTASAKHIRIRSEPTYCLTWATGGIGSAAEYKVYAGLSSPPFRAAGRFAGSSSTIFDRATVSDCGTSLAKRLEEGLF